MRPTHAARPLARAPPHPRAPGRGQQQHRLHPAAAAASPPPPPLLDAPSPPAAMRRSSPPAPSSSSTAHHATAAPPAAPSPAPPQPSRPWPPALAGVPLEADVVALLLVYSVQGLLGLSRLATTFFLREELQLSPAQLALLASASSLPWLVKPLWGFLSDSVPILGSRRRSYLVLAGLGGAAGWAALATPGLVSTPGAALAALTATSCSTAVADVVVDALAVRRSRSGPPSAAGSLQSLCWGASALGGVATALASGSLVASHGPRFVFALTATLPLLVAAVAPLVRDDDGAADGGGGGGGGGGGHAPPQPLAQSFAASARRLGAALSDPGVWRPAAFLFFWQAAPSPDAAMFVFQTEVLGFTPDFLGRARLAAAVASLCGVLLFNAKLKAMPPAALFRATQLAGAALGLCTLALVTGASRAAGIPDTVFAMTDTVLLTVLGQLAFMPTLVLAARLCPDGVEASLFAALMSVFNAAGVAAGAGGAALTAALRVGDAGDWANLPLLIVLCNLLSLAPMPFLGVLDGIGGASTAPGGEAGGGGGESAHAAASAHHGAGADESGEELKSD